MSERLRSLERVKALQKTLADLAGWRLAAAEQAKAALEADRVALEAFVAEALPSGPLASLAGRTLGRLAIREAEAEGRRAGLAATRIQAETRLKLSERFVDALAGAERDAAERRRLEALIDAAAATAEPP